MGASCTTGDEEMKEDRQMASPLDNYGRIRIIYVGCLSQEFRFRVAVDDA